MLLFRLYAILIFLFSLTFLFSNCPDGTDVCLSLDGGNLNYSSTSDIVAFQFDHNGCVVDVSGGDAQYYGLSVFANSFSVIAVANLDNPLPPGEGTLIYLSGDISEDCIYNFYFLIVQMEQMYVYH